MHLAAVVVAMLAVDGGVAVVAPRQPVQSRNDDKGQVGYLVLGGIDGNWALIAGQPLWLSDDGRETPAIESSVIGTGRAVVALDGRKGSFRGERQRSLKSNWDEHGVTMTGFDLGFVPRRPTDVAVIVGRTPVSWEPLVDVGAVLSADDLAIIEPLLATKADRGAAVPAVRRLHLATSADGVRWLTVAQGTGPLEGPWSRVTLLSTVGGAWKMWARFQELVTTANPVALMHAGDQLLVVSVGECRGSDLPTYAVSGKDRSREIAFDCGI